MSRGKWTICKETGKLIPYEKPKPAEVDAPYVRTDEIAPLESMVTGRIHTSKASLYREYKAHGYVVKEKGYVPKRENPYETEAYREKLLEDSTRAYFEARDGMAPLTELDRERCRMIDHNNEHYNYDRRHFDDDGNPRD